MRLPQGDRKRLGNNGSKPDESFFVRDQIKAAIAACSGAAADIVPRRRFTTLDQRPAFGRRQPKLIEGLKAVLTSCFPTIGKSRNGKLPSSR